MYQNCKRAEIDGFVRHSNPDIFRCFHFRYTKGGTNEAVFDYESTQNRTVDDDMENSVTDQLDSNMKLLHIYISNRHLKGNYSTILTSDDVVVTRSELTGYFGRTFAERLFLMTFDSDKDKE